MELNKLIQGIKIKKIIGDISLINVDNISFSSKDISKNTLFICLVGSNTDGHNYAKIALNNGAVAIVCEKEISDLKCVQIIVEDTRIALSLLSANFWGNPSRRLKIIGITGTNGKTSTTMIMRQIFMEAGRSIGVIGTLGYHINSEDYNCDLTTPDPFKLHEIFNTMVKKGVEFVAMEVSAHAIALKKIYGIEFDLGILTNITQDHLDFFKTMENYINTKLEFLNSSSVKSLLINSDDEILSNFEFDSVVTYGLKNPADCFAMNILQNLSGSSFIVNAFDNLLKIKTRLTGIFNIYNILASISASMMMGISANVIESALKKNISVRGRFNILKTKIGDVVIDFAHTPDGLEKILRSVRELSFNKKVITVFGCGGNQDISKRPIMGTIAEVYSDKIILTSDNPKFENPRLIIDDIMSGIIEKDKCIIEVDRVEAIKKGLTMLNKNSVIVICGKGGEKYQDINGIHCPYDELSVLEDLINDLKIKR